MDKCIQCEQEIKQTSNRTRIYCSDKCRMAFKRSGKPIPNTETVAKANNAELPKAGNELKEKHFDLVEVCTEQELENAPLMCETKRESAESIYRLENNKLSELKKKGIWLPNWRRVQGENPGKAPNWSTLSTSGCVWVNFS